MSNCFRVDVPNACSTHFGLLFCQHVVVTNAISNARKLKGPRWLARPKSERKQKERLWFGTRHVPYRVIHSCRPPIHAAQSKSTMRSQNGRRHRWGEFVQPAISAQFYYTFACYRHGFEVSFICAADERFLSLSFSFCWGTRHVFCSAFLVIERERALSYLYLLSHLLGEHVKPSNHPSVETAWQAPLPAVSLLRWYVFVFDFVFFAITSV